MERIRYLKKKLIVIFHLHLLHAVLASPVYPGRQTHFAEWKPASQIALDPQCDKRHASTQLPLLQMSDVGQSSST